MTSPKYPENELSHEGRSRWLRPKIVRLLQRTRLNRIAHRVYYGYLHGFNTANKDVLGALDRAFQEARTAGMDKSGDYCEFGVFKGYAFWYAQNIARALGLTDMRFFGFDSFKGLPEVEGPDVTKDNQFYKGQYSCSLRAVEKNLSAKGVDWDRTFLVEGYFDDTLSEELKCRLSLKRVSIALIDCDLYSSTREVLEFLDGLLLEGSILLFDDWNCFDRDENRGQRRALREYLDKRPGTNAQPLYSYGAYGQVFRFTGAG